MREAQDERLRTSDDRRDPSRDYVPALDGLRALAIIAIIVYHARAAWLPGGFIGVSVFFVLTAYLTTLSITRSLSSGKDFRYASFVAKRAQRLWPTMLVVVGFTAILSQALAPALLPKVKADAIPALLFYENIHYIVSEVSYFANAGSPSPLTHFWYLGVVMQFYLVWPLFLLLFFKVIRSRKASSVIVAALAVASTVLMAVLYSPTGDTARIYYGLDTRGGELLVGALLALVTMGRGLRVTRRGPGARGSRVDVISGRGYDVIGLAALALLVLTAFMVNGYSELMYRGGFLFVAVLAAILVGVVTRPRSLLAAVLGSKPLAAVGKRSFALYLWHFPILDILNPASRTTPLPWWGWVLEFLLIALVSEASYWLIERNAGPTAYALLFGSRGPRRESPRTGSRGDRGRRPEPRGPQLPGPVEAVLSQGAPRLALEVVSVVAVIVLLLVPLDPEAANTGQAKAPTQNPEELSQAAQEGRRYDVSDTLFGGSPLEAAFSSINSASFNVDSSTGATDAKVLLVGDSVPAGAADQFYQVFPNGYLDAAVGRQLYAGPEAYREDIANGHDGDVVVWSLGNNGIAREDQVRELITMVGEGKKVYLVTARVPEELQDLNNALFKKVAADYDNVGVIDWHAASEGHDEYFWGDGTHLRPEGAMAYVMTLRKGITGR